MPLPDPLRLSRIGHRRLDQLADQRTLRVGVARLTQWVLVEVNRSKLGAEGESVTRNPERVPVDVTAQNTRQQY